MYVEIASDDAAEVERVVVDHLRRQKDIRLIGQVRDGRWSVTLHDLTDEPAVSTAGSARDS